MIINFRSSNGIYGTIEYDEFGKLVEYQLIVPEDIVLLPVTITVSNKDNITLIQHGVNRMKQEVKVDIPPMEESYKPLSKYDIAKHIFNV